MDEKNASGQGAGSAGASEPASATVEDPVLPGYLPSSVLSEELTVERCGSGAEINFSDAMIEDQNIDKKN